MARKSPAQKLTRIQQSIEAWEALAPDSTFFGMTLDQFKAACRPSLQLREEIAAARELLRILIGRRVIADDHLMPQIEGVSFSIGGNPKFGQDSLLYARFGYIRRSARRKRGKKR